MTTCRVTATAGAAILEPWGDRCGWNHESPDLKSQIWNRFRSRLVLANWSATEPRYDLDRRRIRPSRLSEPAAQATSRGQPLARDT